MSLFFPTWNTSGGKKSQYSNIITIAHDTAIKARIIVHKTEIVSWEITK